MVHRKPQKYYGFFSGANTLVTASWRENCRKPAKLHPKKRAMRRYSASTEPVSGFVEV